MEIVVFGIGALAFMAWLAAVVSWVRALGHRAEGVSVSSLMLNGMKSFDADSFTAEGQVHQRRFLKAFGLFFLFVFLGVAASVLLVGP